MLLTFCLLLTCTFLLSLTYRQWPVPARSAEHQLRIVLAAVASVLLLLNTQEVGPYKIDLRFVPLALITLRYGVGPGLLVAAGPVVLRVRESDLGGRSALVNALSVGPTRLGRPMSNRLQWAKARYRACRVRQHCVSAERSKPRPSRRPCNVRHERRAVSHWRPRLCLRSRRYRSQSRVSR